MSAIDSFEMRNKIGVGELCTRDEALSQRAQGIKAKCEALLIEITGNRRLKELPADKLTPKRVCSFTSVLKRKLLGEDRSFAKAYVHLLVDEIRLNGTTIVMTGSENALMGTAIEGEKGASGKVLSQRGVWLTGADARRKVFATY